MTQQLVKINCLDIIQIATDITYCVEVVNMHFNEDHKNIKKIFRRKLVKKVNSKNGSHL